MQFPMFHYLSPSQNNSYHDDVDEEDEEDPSDVSKSGWRSPRIFQGRGESSELHSETISVQLQPAGEPPFSHIDCG